MGRTGLCRECVFVVEQALDPGEDVVDVRRCWEADLSLVGVDPGEVEATTRHVRELAQSARAPAKGRWPTVASWTYPGPADMVGQASTVSYSMMMP
jgi:hypothetical protein